MVACPRVFRYTIGFLIYWALLILSPGLAQARTWTDNTGTFKIEAELVAIKADAVQLKKANGVVISVPLRRLSVADREFLKQQPGADPATAPPPGVTDGTPPPTPEAAVKAQNQALANGRIDLLWQTLPPSYRSQVADLVHTLGESMDKEIWNGGFGVAQKLIALLRDKKDFIVGSKFAEQAPIDSAEVAEEWDVIVGVFDTIVNSELSDLDKVKTLDMDSFLTGTGVKVHTQLLKLVPLSPDPEMTKMLQDLRSATYAVESNDGETAVVNFNLPMQVEGETTTATMRKVDGYWVPAEMAQELPSSIAMAKSQLAEMQGEQLAGAKPQILGVLAMAGGVLDRLQAAESQEAFDQVLEESIKPLLPMLGGATPPTGDDPFGPAAGPPGADPFGEGGAAPAADPFGEDKKEEAGSDDPFGM